MKNHITEIILNKPKSRLDLLLEKEEVKDNIIGMPDANKYYVIPHSKPILRSFINNFSWLSIKNIIKIEINENPQFSAWNWFSNLPLNDNDDVLENITLVIQDSNENELNRIQFNKIKLIKHKCNLSNNFDETQEFKPVKHILLLSYHDLLVGKKEIEKHESEIQLELI